jgi:hypothetical protein
MDVLLRQCSSFFNFAITNITGAHYFTGGTILSQSGNPGEQGMHGGGTIVQYSGQDGSLVSYVPGNAKL